ncbi:MAG: HNH endonuclease [Nitrososphaeraceae archaeon]
MARNRKDSVKTVEEIEYLLSRDGNICFYCKMPFEKNIVWHKSVARDHLNDNPNDNRLENIVLCHQECNLIKKYFIDWKIMGLEKLRMNEMTISPEVTSMMGKAKVDKTSQIDINQIVNKETDLYLTKFLPEKPIDGMPNWLDFNDTADSLTELTQDKFSVGSQDAFKRCLSARCSTAGKFRRVEIDGRFRIYRKGK